MVPGRISCAFDIELSVLVYSTKYYPVMPSYFVVVVLMLFCSKSCFAHVLLSSTR